MSIDVRPSANTPDMLTSVATTISLLLLGAALVESTGEARSATAGRPRIPTAIPPPIPPPTSAAAVFLRRNSAEQILRSTAAARRRRANAMLLEEMFPGDLERECYEERCSQEEAAEIFQSREKTLEFWFRYTNLSPCASNPCVNGGKCMLERGDFLCLCPPRYHGSTCHLEVASCVYRNGGCLQYCTDLPGGTAVQCGCADGFKLESDGRSCSKTVAFPCGIQQAAVLERGRALWNLSDDANFTAQTDFLLDDGNFTEEMDANVTGNTEDILDGGRGIRFNNSQRIGESLNPRIVGGALERLGGSPWQVLIRRADGYGFCGGTLVSDRWVISAAHCFQQTAHHVTIGDYDKQRRDPGEQNIPVERVLPHPHYHDFTMDSDVALVYLARPVVRGPSAIPACLPDPHLSKKLLKEDNRGLVTGWGATHYLRRSSRFLRKVALPVVNQRACAGSTEQVITDNMFCAGYVDAPMDACSGDSGGPFVVNYRGTWFLTGVVSWGERCAAKGKYGVYTRLGNFLSWIRTTMEKVDRNATLS
ncbi:coagulation factor X isoform X1 [Hippocampus zosterae]|uniref:coagulation factor X isoform X1 n=1 Tax=Hippocampus zosterae TaxID=109293 RepID=UPI00223CB9E9|nr:coagulation factor X isoform X1 [Hippocampus zosterae]XP_051911043.1 coagulation factor X isoform X1 [Hippocampus zosterae]